MHFVEFYNCWNGKMNSLQTMVNTMTAKYMQMNFNKDSNFKQNML